MMVVINYGQKGRKKTQGAHDNLPLCPENLHEYYYQTALNPEPPSLGVKVLNMKMDFNTGGTWRGVGQ